MPAGFGARTMIAFKGVLLFRRSHRWGLKRVEADDHDPELSARIEGQSAEAAGKALEHLITKHRAAVVHERQNHRLTCEIVSQANNAPSLVVEGQLKRHRSVELRIKAYLAQQGRQAAYRRCLGSDRRGRRSEEHTSELQSRLHLVCRLLLEKKKKYTKDCTRPQRRTIICFDCLPT